MNDRQAEVTADLFWRFLDAHQLLADAIPHVPPNVAARFRREIDKHGLRLMWREASEQFDGSRDA